MIFWIHYISDGLLEIGPQRLRTNVPSDYHLQQTLYEYPPQCTNSTLKISPKCLDNDVIPTHLDIFALFSK